VSDILDVRIALGPALIAVHGTQPETVLACYADALELVDRLADVSRRFPVLWGLWFVAFTRGQYQEAHESAQELLRVAQAGDDIGRLLEAHHSLWATLTAMGRPADAAVHAERGIELYDRDSHASHAFFYGGHDPGACCRYHLAIDRWLLGYPDQALATVREAYSVAEQLGHAMTTFITLGFMACVHYQRGEREAAAETAERVRLLADSHGFKNWPEAGIVMTHARATAHLDGAALAEIGQRCSRSAAWRGFTSSSSACSPSSAPTLVIPNRASVRWRELGRRPVTHCAAPKSTGSKAS
jgi:tetratricopeptide (TPR) repeat protein